MLAALIAAQLIASAIERPEGLRLQEPSAIDGDTIHDGHRTQGYRLFGIDTPELARAKCSAEKALGLAASARVQGLLDAAREVRAFPAWNPKGRPDWPTDGFERRIARIEIDGKDLGELLLAEGLAKPYDGEGEHPDWCGSGPNR